MNCIHKANLICLLMNELHILIMHVCFERRFRRNAHYQLSIYWWVALIQIRDVWRKMRCWSNILRCEEMIQQLCVNYCQHTKTYIRHTHVKTAPHNDFIKSAIFTNKNIASVIIKHVFEKICWVVHQHQFDMYVWVTAQNMFWVNDSWVCVVQMQKQWCNISCVYHNSMQSLH